MCLYQNTHYFRREFDIIFMYFLRGRLPVCLQKITNFAPCIGGASCMSISIGLFHPLDGITNLKYKLLRLWTPTKKFIENGTSN